MTAIAAFAISIEFCVLIGVFMSFMLAVPRTGQHAAHASSSSPSDRTVRERLRRRRRLRPHPDLRPRGRDVLRLGRRASSSTSTRSRRASRPETQVVVLRLKRARNPDAVGMALLEKFVDRLQARGVARRPVRRPALDADAHAAHCGLDREARRPHIFLEQPVKQTSTVLAIRYAYELLTDFCPTCPRRDNDRAARVLRDLTRFFTAEARRRGAIQASARAAAQRVVRPLARAAPRRRGLRTPSRRSAGACRARC